MPATDSFFRKPSAMHVVFAASMLILMVATVWMLAADHIDAWRNYQSTFYNIEAELIENGIDQNVKEIEAELEKEGDSKTYESKVKQLNDDVDELGRELEQNNQKYSELSETVEDLRNQVDLIGRRVRFERADRDVARANYDLGVRDQVDKPDLDSLKQKYDVLLGIVTKSELELEGKEGELEAAINDLNVVTKDRDDKADMLKQLQTDIDLKKAALATIDPKGIWKLKRWTMEWPIIDGFNSHHKIIQDWIPDLQQTLGMTSIARFDRCRTCHLGINRIEAGNLPTFPHGETESTNPEEWVKDNKYPHPFSTHPRTDVYLTAASPHPLPEFGCTICHEGQGSGTSFQNASHSPNDPHQEHEWHKEFGYFHNHYWEYSMYPKRFQQSTCLKCHHSVIELGINPKFGPTASKVYEGWQLVRTYGCFSCHEIHGFDAGQPIGPDLRLEPQTAEDAAKIAADPNLIAGLMRKVGPSLRHLADKTTVGWVEYWTRKPSDFRPKTRMPQFFGLENQHDKLAENLQPVELAGIASFLFDKSKPLTLDSPQAGYFPSRARGEKAFSLRGCLNCHSYQGDEFRGVDADFGPDLSKLHLKVKPPREGQSLFASDGFKWLYTWIREPNRHHPRTKMPDLFLDPTVENGQHVDPAADIAYFLLSKGPGNYRPIAVGDSPFVLDDDNPLDKNSPLNQLVYLYLSKALKGGMTKAEEVLEAGGPFPEQDPEQVKGDEIELLGGPFTKEMKLRYVGRRTISRYGCYGCHDISGFERARPIGTTLQDWGRKDISKLAPEHIEEFLHHHGEDDGSSTHDRVVAALKSSRSGSFDSHEQEEQEMSAVFYYESLIHHGRPGFLWQKLRSPRSYDFEKTSTKGYDERLRMPEFPFDERQIEAIATFILGLVAEPPSEKYIFNPQGPAKDRIDGERLLQKYNCIGCHMIELPEIRYGANPDQLAATVLQPGDYEQGRDLLLQLKPPHNGLTGQHHHFDNDGEKETLPVVTFRGLISNRPDPQDDPIDQEYAYDLWETLEVDGKQLLPGERMLVPATRLIDAKDRFNGYTEPGRGGPFAEWLVDKLLELGDAENNRSLAWQMAPPPLYKEGIKVQTPWLYQFLKDPGRIRHTTVLRMPRFNMDDDEARSLANYFAAVDVANYPYQLIREREPAYLSARQQQFATAHPDRSNSYLAESWQMLNEQLCIKCHAVGGRPYLATPPAPGQPPNIQGPNLDLATNRLRPEWTLLWLYKPSWITPFTSMPAPFPKNQSQYAPLFGGSGGEQTIGVRDALMNYNRLMESEGKLDPPAATAAGGGSGE